MARNVTPLCNSGLSTISLSLKPDRATKYPSCFMEEKSVNGEPNRLTKFNATHISKIKKRNTLVNDLEEMFVDLMN